MGGERFGLGLKLNFCNKLAKEGLEVSLCDIHVLEHWLEGTLFWDFWIK